MKKERLIITCLNCEGILIVNNRNPDIFCSKKCKSKWDLRFANSEN